MRLYELSEMNVFLLKFIILVNKATFIIDYETNDLS